MLKSSLRKFLALLFFLGCVYSLWLIAFWPGVLGQDSLAIILEVESNRAIQASKPGFWFLYNNLLYGPWSLVEIPILVQSAITISIMARILTWMLDHRLFKSFWYSLLFIALGPSVLYYSIALYSDGIYAISMIGMLFEIWLSYRDKRLSRVSMAMLAITFPFAIFARPNGFINIFAVVALFLALGKKQRWQLALIIAPWCAIGIYATSQYKSNAPMGTIFPLAVYETVGFLEHRPMGLWENNEPRITDKSIGALTSNGATLETISKHYDHYYWDPLIFATEGPALSSLSKKAKRTIIREFFKYNLWHNMPAFMASRVNIFLYSALANGGIPPPHAAKFILTQTHSKSEIRFRNGKIHSAFLSAYNFALSHRAIFWAPWLGIFLIFAAPKKTLRTRDHAGSVICITFLLQLTAVFFFSIAGEYRYLLAFFMAPLVLLPVRVLSKSSEPLEHPQSEKQESKNSKKWSIGRLATNTQSMATQLLDTASQSKLRSFFSRVNLDLCLTAIWLTWMLVAATKRMIRFFPPPEAPLNNDAYWTYLPNAKNFLQAPWYFLTQIEDSFYVAPLGYIWPAVWGGDHVTTQLANCVLFLLSVVLMWRLATRLGGLLAGMVSTALLVHFPDLLTYIPQVLTESLYLFSILLLLTAVADYVLSTSRKRIWLALAALGLTLSLLSRPVLQIFTLAVLLVVLGGLWFRRKSVAPVFQGWGLLINGSVAIALIAALILPAATIVKNGVCFHYWGLSTGAGSGLYYGVSPHKMGVEPVYSGFEYDASIVPKTADTSTKGHPLKPRSDEIMSRVAVSVISNTTLADNIRFFTFKLKTWLFYGEEEIRMRPEMRTLRVFEWMAITLAALAILARGLHREPTNGNLCWQVPAHVFPNADGQGNRRLAIAALLLLLTIAMAAQLTPVLYNIRYNNFFLEPMLIALCGVSISVLLRPSLQRTHSFNQQNPSSTGVRWPIWALSSAVIVALLAYVPHALTAHAKRHRAWSMDPLRPGPTQPVLVPSQMQTPNTTNATLASENEWMTTQRPATLTIPFEVDKSTYADAFMDGIWRLKLAVRPPHEDRNCTNVRMELTTPSTETLWYAPEPLIRVQADGNMHMYAIRGNGALRPTGSGAITLTFNCPAGTKIAWGNAQLLRVTMPQAARALIEDGTPINPYRADDIK